MWERSQSMPTRKKQGGSQEDTVYKGGWGIKNNFLEWAGGM